MIVSMTGFGASEVSSDVYSLKAEVKTLNSKFFDPILKIPKEFSIWELEIKGALEKILRRGKINLSLEFITQSDAMIPVHINETLFDVYFKKFDKLAHEHGATADELFKLALHAPNVMEPRDDFAEMVNPQDVIRVIEEAALKCDDFRKNEGERLFDALKSSINTIEKYLELVQKLDPKRVENIRSRIEKSISELKDQTKLDENRFEQELIYYIEKLDISEEKVRLRSHLDYFMEVMDAKDSNGKKLGFISQEIGREINTIGSKANDAEIQRAVVNMKEALEKIKEQVLNVI
jgi:uncharacterized protein (TIGR00255 family)